MFQTGQDSDFINDISSAALRDKSNSHWRLLVVLLVGIGGFFVWAYFYEIEEVTRGPGRVIPSSQIQVVQSLEGGIVRSIDIREGDMVNAGQVLMHLDDTGFSSQLGELLEKESALLAEKARLEAEAGLAQELSFPDGLESRNTLATTAEAEVFFSRRTQLDQELSVLANRLAQRRAELAELEGLREKISIRLAPLDEEIQLTEELVLRGAVPRIELLRLKSQRAESTGDLIIANASEPRIKAGILEAETQIQAARASYVSSARERLARLQVELAVVQEGLRAAKDRVTRTTVRSPTKGIVNTVNVSTIGAVVQPGAPLAEVVPADDRLLVEVDIRPQDVAFIRPGEQASVKITAYDYLVYGSLSGKVTRIGADTIENAQGDQFFRIVVETDKAYLGSDEEPLQIIPGMVATVDIQTGRKTVLSYLGKPVLRASAEALRER
ncbi:HlyD family type I secretion periplasmic adaptor subunit [Sulfitobacter sp. JBTF-M27]|uniref:Membrane fusion protein (MFP) family protein n=1 Tax=Sulfitobacter sediminilitoris TaxID=2698830 RepID=A0A6P0CG02_9RHOB|nr:HlyD family type I secretion periplasmic adaptor subunit [Sulfitobacter sediminilitoris]NEK25111.1 HlyD family type I secretion periplasmic adaptor subunit [Sulfitobacter sediminilitoris]